MWIYCLDHAGAQDNERAERLALIASAATTITIGKGDMAKTIHKRMLVDDSKTDETAGQE